MELTPQWKAVIEEIISREVPPGRSPVEHNPNDPGGVTAWGLSQAAHPDIDVVTLTKDDAIRVYWSRYITPTNLHLLNNIKLGGRLADFAVVCGPGAMSYAVKTALFLLGKPVNTGVRLLTADEVKAINGLKGEDAQAFTRLINSIQGLIFWMGFVQARRAIAEALANPHRRPFLKGWMRARIWEV
jgi:hypothetical protein